MAKKNVARTRYALCVWLGTRQVGEEKRAGDGTHMKSTKWRSL